MSSLSLAVDTRPIPDGTNEELAGPPHAAIAPVARQERISSIDTLRGFALMGILLMNITSFGMSVGNYTFPLSTVKPVFSGPHWKVNTICWFVRWVVAEGKMRALFSMLFGAGVILLTKRAEERGAGVKVADIYTRRNLWLVLFGLLHAYFIWEGDILFFYGVAALLFLFPFRNVRPRRLMWVAGIVLLLNSVVLEGGQTIFITKTQKQGAQARAAYAKNHVVTEEQRKAIDSADQQQGNFRKSPKKIYEDISAEQKNYLSAQAHDAKDVFQGHTKGAYVGFGDWFGMMLLGMALYKNGFLSGKLKTSTYVWVAVIGLGISWPLIFAGAFEAWKSHFDMLTTFRWMLLPYGVGRVAGALGNAAVVLLVLRAGVLSWLMKAVASVGQMALSNYLLTSFSLRMLFVWSHLKWYGYMEYYKLYIVVLCVWIVNMTWSTLWLQHFQFGPMEWVWRSLTYWKRQPMRLRPKKAKEEVGEAGLPEVATA
jgi:uncharacterized protein